DEVRHYLSTAVEDPGQDVLAWWRGKAKLYPRLSCMARDYLIIPATSVDVERVFSRGRQLLPYNRNRLSTDSIRALLCVGAWSRMDFVRDNDVMKAV
ncbi:putative AC transposase, partial [Exidia glandulosa HHB12029]